MTDIEELKLVRNAIENLAIVCGGDEATIINVLTGYLWTEDEARKIRNTTQSTIN